MYEWYDGSVYMIAYTYGTYICIRCAWFMHVLEFWPKATLASSPGRWTSVSVQTWTPTLTPASSDLDANFSDLHALQSQKFQKQGNSPIGELSPTIWKPSCLTCVRGELPLLYIQTLLQPSALSWLFARRRRETLSPVRKPELWELRSGDLELHLAIYSD